MYCHLSLVECQSDVKKRSPFKIDAKNEARLNFFVSLFLSNLELESTNTKMSEWKDELNNESDDLKDLEPVTDSKPSATTEETNETTEDSTEVDKVETHEICLLNAHYNNGTVNVGIRGYEAKSERHGS